MTDQHGELDAALERVIDAARAHLTAVRAAQGRIDDDDVWQAYVALNNASFAYDEQLLDAFGEVTPWDVESIDPDEADERFGGAAEGAEATDPHPQVISVRQRRDYRVPSVSALLRVAEVARREGTPEDDEPAPVEGVGEAVLELLQSGDGSLSALDVPELEPLDGVVMVSEVGTPVDLESFDDDDPVGPFSPAADDRLVGRLDEHPFLDEDDHDHAGHQH
ncbi:MULTISPECIES: hypothetical protein [Micromonospora]|uniref:Uncharacterized protein n=1 Tax=Micromonospora antibiotica TaxID=2807623 RepID=A0ABS3V4W2_9ACTN|nr:MULTISPECIES: hypothetical protein [Micromonospora]MBO4160634.1 hypothetical protein [Micromonospora antibiotica]MBW4700771.1 hypothetical protein [Micromonospora sp. RL09-050-HVF-A]